MVFVCYCFTDLWCVWCCAVVVVPNPSPQQASVSSPGDQPPEPSSRGLQQQFKGPVRKPEVRTRNILTIVKFWDILFLNVDHNLLRLLPPEVRSRS